LRRNGLLSQRWVATSFNTNPQLATELHDVAVTVHFDPNIKAKEFKVKRFYRSALRSSMQFDVDGNEVAPVVSFNDMPGTPIFTLAMHTINSWVVRPTESPLDLDNLLLGRLNEPTHVLFHLKQLVIDGHARDEESSPPRGLQLHLKKGNEVVSDTQVMANLGYLQFKATPGVYSLAIREGRGTEVYEIASAGADGWDSDSVNVTGTTITLDSFDTNVIFPRFAHRPGMEMADVLRGGEGEQEGFVSQVLSKMKSLVGLKDAAPATRHADINIFTVASGLLYERFASIMILSVMKHTQSTVKFWFIENFLSPTFINFLPHLAKEYGFEYELVTYKWPSWLRAQTEKQRIIWAYKILFLDVLFPMDLDKVIFVDADQIVRVDMKELVDVDLQGRVYGYPPMGNDREEMEGFRFWKTGYWKEELRGNPYHISALYVVDLKRFRQRATGDMLRGTYQALSADPNSLANLDQDLPNSMQRQIPIFTLDQDWLWCQTWCSDESLTTAKTSESSEVAERRKKAACVDKDENTKKHHTDTPSRPVPEPAHKGTETRARPPDPRMGRVRPRNCRVCSHAGCGRRCARGQCG
jgi:UDP-glucose:glycoprotein glucosyltransferase